MKRMRRTSRRVSGEKLSFILLAIFSLVFFSSVVYLNCNFLGIFYVAAAADVAEVVLIVILLKETN